MATDTHQLKHNTWFNRLCFRLNNIRKLGFNYLVGGFIVTGGKDKPNDSVVAELANRYHVNIAYSKETINGKALQKLTVWPKGECKNITLFYQGHGITTARPSMIENMIEHVVRGDRMVVAYDQSGVGGSSGYQHSSEYTLREDIQAQAESAYKLLESCKQQGRIKQDAKLDIYGLCFGGVLSAIAADALKDKSDFSRVTISRAPAKLWEMVALCRDYRLFFPHLGLDTQDSRAQQSSQQRPSSWLAWIAGGVSHTLVSMAVWVLNLKTYLPDLVRRLMIYPIFAAVGWCLNVTPALRNVEKRNKLKVLSLNTYEEGSDEFVAPAADMAQCVKESTALTYLAPSEQTKGIYQAYFAKWDAVNRAFQGNKPADVTAVQASKPAGKAATQISKSPVSTVGSSIHGQGFLGYWQHMICHQPATAYRHQAWSTTLFCRNNNDFFCPHVDELAMAVREGEQAEAVNDHGQRLALVSQEGPKTAKRL